MSTVQAEPVVPDPTRAVAYDDLFAEYLALHDHFGRDTPAMHRLRAMRRVARERGSS
jgi:L-ribulokinase